MDLSTLKVRSDSATLTLKHPATGKVLMDERTDPPSPMTISLLSADSTEYKERQNALQDDRLQQSLGRGRRLKLSAEQLEEDALSLLAAATTAWSGFYENGKPLSCDHDTVRRVYATYSWIREQVDEFVNDRSNFLGN